jgi:isopenicillin N synthase-like dioxygenase
MGPAGDFSHTPIIDVSELVGGPSRRAVAERLGEACRESGFLCVVGHGVDEPLQARLRELSRESFAQDPETKQRIRMALGAGPAGAPLRPSRFRNACLIQTSLPTK